MEHKSTQSDSDTENAEIKLANEKLLEEKEKLGTELPISVSGFSRLSGEQKNENIQLKRKKKNFKESTRRKKICWCI